jgi:hypothetical protein
MQPSYHEDPFEPNAAHEQGDESPFADGPGARQLVLVKHGQRYVFRYTAGDEPLMLGRLVELVRDPSSELDWFDAAVLSHQMGQRMGEQMASLLNP